MSISSDVVRGRDPAAADDRDADGLVELVHAPDRDREDGRPREPAVAVAEDGPAERGRDPHGPDRVDRDEGRGPAALGGPADGSAMSVTFGVSLTQTGRPRSGHGPGARLDERGVRAERGAVALGVGAGEVQLEPGDAARRTRTRPRRNSSGDPPKIETTTGSPATAPSSSTKARDGFGSPIAFSRPSSSGTRHGPAWPGMGAGPIDLVTTPPAPFRSCRASEAPVVPRTPAASTRWFRQAHAADLDRPGLERQHVEYRRPAG